MRANFIAPRRSDRRGGLGTLETVAGLRVHRVRSCDNGPIPFPQLAAENLFLRKQLALHVERQVKPRRADDTTRIALVALSWLIDWRRIFMVVKPDTLIRWHRKGFQLFWRWKSMPCGRPRVPADLQRLIAQMAAANRTWGEERIASELLLKLGIRVSPRTVRRYMPRVPRLGVAGSRSCGARLCAITPTRCWHAISS